MPAAAVLYGLLVVVSFSMSHSIVEVEGTDWLEPVLLWVSICMPTGSGKTSLCKFLKQLVDDTHANVGSDSSSWFIDDQSMEKMGALMNENNSKLLGLYDELAMFLSQMSSGEKVLLIHMKLLYFCNYMAATLGLVKQVCNYLCFLKSNKSLIIHRKTRLKIR